MTPNPKGFTASETGVTRWNWRLEGEDITYRGTRSDIQPLAEGVTEGETLGEALTWLIEEWSGFELLDPEQPFTLTVEPAAAAPTAPKEAGE